MLPVAYQYPTKTTARAFRNRAVHVLTALFIISAIVFAPDTVTAQSSTGASDAGSVMDRIRAKMREIKPSAPSESQSWFDNLDRDKSGDISKQELFESIRQRFDAMDTDGDKLVSKSEYMKSRKDGVSGEARFGRLDTNKDGRLDMSEFASPADWRFDRIDRNLDGVISQSESEKLFDQTEGSTLSEEDGQCFYVDRQIVRVKEKVAESLIKRGFPKADCEWVPDVQEQEKAKKNAE